MLELRDGERPLRPAQYEKSHAGAVEHGAVVVPDDHRVMLTFNEQPHASQMDHLRRSKPEQIRLILQRPEHVVCDRDELWPPFQVPGHSHVLSGFERDVEELERVSGKDGGASAFRHKLGYPIASLELC